MRRKVFLFVVAATLVFLAFYFLSRKIVIAAVTCANKEGSCSGEIENMLQAQIGRNYFDAKRELEKNLRESSKVKSFNLRFIFPSALNLEVVEKEAVIAMVFAPERIFLFDEESNVVGEVRETQLPTLKVVESASDRSITFAAGLFKDLNKYYKITSGELTRFGLKANISGAEVTFPLEGDIDIILGSLEVVILRFSTGKSYTVDLRYKNPVIKENE